jgi:transposase-like protein
MQSLSCPNRHCPPSGKGNVGAIIRHGFCTTRSGKRRRYQCRTCGKTFCSATRTPYYRLQHRRATFDEVASLSVEGVNKSAIARAKRVAFHEKARCCQDRIRGADVFLSPRLARACGSLIVRCMLLRRRVCSTPDPTRRLPSALSVVLFFRTRCTLGSDPLSMLLSGIRASKRSSSPIPRQLAQSPRLGTGGCLGC